MTWITKVPAWVIPLVSEFLVPEEATVQTGVDFDDLDEGDEAVNSFGRLFTAKYPGIVPSYAVEPLSEVTTSGTYYVLKVKKGVAFYAVKTKVTAFDENKINSWEFPLDRKNFGYITVSRDGFVLGESRIAYGEQFHTALLPMMLLLNYDDQFDRTNLFNSADKLGLTQIDVVLSPTVEVEYTFMPIWEVWALKWFQAVESD